ncbi:ABC transporter permease [bacterium]|nr:ABC transporter permease [bacterium]
MILDTDSWQEIFITLKSNKLRSILTAFGVFWGILMLVIMLGAGKGLQNGVTDDFSRFASNAVYMWTRATTIPYQGLPKGRRFSFDNDDIEALKQNIPEIEYIAPRIQLSNADGKNNVTRGLRTGTFNVYGDYPDVIHIRLMEMIQGRFLNELDIKNKRKVAVIGKRVYEELFPQGEKSSGEYIEISGVFFQVVGVFDIESLAGEDHDDLKTVYVPLTSFQQSFNYGRRIGWFSLTSKKGISVSVVKDKAVKLLIKRHKVSPDDTRAIGFWDSEKEFNKIYNLFTGIDFLIWFVGIFTLIAGVIGVSNIMLIVVKERTKEIGIKRALGATPFHIVSQIMSESVLLTSFSGYWGLVVGVGLLEAVSAFVEKTATRSSMFRHPEVDINIALVSLLVLIISGALAGLIPARRAISIKPVDAIRQE